MAGAKGLAIATQCGAPLLQTSLWIGRDPVQTCFASGDAPPQVCILLAFLSQVSDLQWGLRAFLFSPTKLLVFLTPSQCPLTELTHFPSFLFLLLL